MGFSHTMGGTTFTQANFEGNAYSDESTGFPKAMEKMVEHVANAYRGISTTSNAVGTGSKTWTVTNSNSQIPAFAVGMPVRVARTSAPSTTFMQGEITAFNASTGSTTVNVSSVKGSGTHTDWTITVGGHQTTASASPLAISDGGTGATTASAALTALGGVGAGANSSITSLTGLTTPLTVAQGGSGAATHTANGVLLGAGTGALTTAAPGSSGNVLTSNGTVWASAAAAGGTEITDQFKVQGATQSDVTGDGTAYTVVFTSSEVYDAGGVFTTSTYTASVAGKAHLAFIIEMGPFTSSHDRFMLRLVTSNRDYVMVDMSPGGNLTNNGGYRRFPGSTIADFDASDTAYITVTAYNGTKTVDTTYTNDLTFSGYLIAD